MEGFSVVLDAPASAGNRIQIAQLGEYKDGRYGEFQITRQDVESWKSNLSRLPGGRALIDLDHQADRTPRKTEASGWITDIGWDGDTPMADVEWTPAGRQAIEEKRYLFFSPTYGPLKDEHGETHENVLQGGALTNKPFLTSMPALTLASDETLSAAVAQLDRENADRLRAAAPAPDSESDSQRTMDTEVLTALDLGEDTDVAAAVARIEELKANAERAAETRTLEQAADAEGKKVISLDTYRELAGASERIGKLEQERSDERFVRLFDDCQRAGKVLPDEREGFHELHQETPAAAAKMLAKRLESGPQLINTKPSGWDNGNVQAGDAPPGVDSGAHQLHTKVMAKVRELGKDPARDYQTVLDRMIEGGEL